MMSTRSFAKKNTDKIDITKYVIFLLYHVCKLQYLIYFKYFKNILKIFYYILIIYIFFYN